MADDTDIDQTLAARNAPPSIPQDDRLAPMLSQIRDTLTPNDDGASTWADPALAAIQQHTNATAVVDANQAAGNHFVQQVGNLKDTLLGMVQDDPTSVPLALRLAPRLVAPLVYSTGMGDDDAEATHQDLTSHIQGQIAHSAVLRMADLNPAAAHGMIDQLAPYLGEGDADPLHGYVNTMQAAQRADAFANSQSMATNAARASGRAAYQFGSSLLDPRTEEISIPPDFTQSLVRNRAISPDDKQPLFEAFSRLLNPGDVVSSNPYTVRQLLADIGNPAVPVAHGDITSHVGDDLRYADAVMLHGMNLQRTPDGQGAVRQLGKLLDDAQSALASGQDRAGNAAYSRFVNWLLPSYRRTGPSGLNPSSDNYLFNGMSLDNWRPSSADAVAPIRPVNQRSLGEIFAGNSPPGFNEKINRLRELEQLNTAPEAPPSGKFFQRKLEESQQKEEG